MLTNDSAVSTVLFSLAGCKFFESCYDVVVVSFTGGNVYDKII